jgi:ubiquinone biosynthesis protein
METRIMARPSTPTRAAGDHPRMRLSRLAEITSVFVEEGLGFLTEKKPDAPEGSAPDDAASTSMPSAEVAARLRRTLEKLGPTFVKFGQMLATRIDLFGPEIVDELSKLQSHVPPFPTAEARAIVEEQLGKTIDEVFAEFPDAAVAAASIAQVYRARLKTGERVAVKVQRPNLEQSLLSDLEVLVDVSGLIDRLVPAYRRSMVHRVAEEYANRARGELDFEAEARIIDEFGALFVTHPEFRAPRVHAALSTPRVLVMEWLEGTKLDTIKTPEALREAGYPPHDFARSMLRLQVSMAYEHGLIHGDTHPGNLILLGPGEDGLPKIGVIDFGLHARVPPTLRDKMLEMVLHQAAGRIDESIEAYCSVLTPDPSVDLAAFKRDLREVFDGAGEKGKQTMGEGPITKQFVRALRVASKHRIKAQSELFVVIRNLTIVEGIVARYAPDLDPVPEVRTITADIVKRRLTGPRMREEMTALMPQLFLTISKRPQLVERLLKLERSFVESASLGEFLEKQDVIRRPPPARTSAWVLAAVLVFGVVVGVLIDRALGR